MAHVQAEIQREQLPEVVKEVVANVHDDTQHDELGELVMRAMDHRHEHFQLEELRLQHDMGDQVQDVLNFMCITLSQSNEGEGVASKIHGLRIVSEQVAPIIVIAATHYARVLEVHKYNRDQQEFPVLNRNPNFSSFNWTVVCIMGIMWRVKRLAKLAKCMSRSPSMDMAIDTTRRDSSTVLFMWNFEASTIITVETGEVSVL